MGNEDMICPCCGRPKISLPLVDDNNNYQLKFENSIYFLSSLLSSLSKLSSNF